MKKVSAFLGGLGLLAASALPVFAQQDIDPCAAGQRGGTNFSRLCSLNAGSIGNIVSTIVTVLLIAAVLIALFFLIWGGIRWITSGGDKGKVDEARKHIVAAIIGLIIAFLAYFFLQLVLGFFGLQLGDLRLPVLTP
ncbi:MAG TPA: pilin [Xanthomonadales bacterium]|nr:pilin [Xanthomonadales bacterium]